MFDNIAGIETGLKAPTNTVVNQIDNLLELAKNRVGQRDALQQWINKNVLTMPEVPESAGKFFTIVREFDTVQKPVSDTVWIIALLSIQQQGYTSVPLLSAVAKTSINESTGKETTQEAWTKVSTWILNTLVKMGMVETKLQEMETPKGMRTQTLFYIHPNWSKAHLNPIIEEMREKVNIVCKPLDFQPPNWMEGEKHQQRTKLKLVSSKADTLVEYRVSKEALEPLNKLQSIGFEVAEGHTEDINDCLDEESDELKRDSFTELLSLQGKRFFYPVSCDYRLRMYYRGGAVNPQGQKNVRMFLNFSEGEAVNRLDAIEDLTTALLDRENPVQRAELERLEKLTSETVICKVVINLDGTANGLQHQSLLLRSKQLARLTKLVVDTIKEVYEYVTERIVAAGVKTSRKEIKKIVMTASYGATKNTLLEKLRETMTPQEALLSFEIMNQEIPELKQYTNFITSRCNQFKNLDCEMNTPDGFEMKFRKVDRTASTLYAGKFSAIVGTDFAEDKEATARATAPNIVHMLDSYHLRSIVRQWEGNISTIHDSVGVTAGRGKELKQVILGTFKEMHKNNFLESWAHANNVTSLKKLGELELEEINNLDMFC